MMAQVVWFSLRFEWNRSWRRGKKRLWALTSTSFSRFAIIRRKEDFLKKERIGYDDDQSFLPSSKTMIINTMFNHQRNTLTMIAIIIIIIIRRLLPMVHLHIIHQPKSNQDLSWSFAINSANKSNQRCHHLNHDQESEKHQQILLLLGLLWKDNKYANGSTWWLL